MFKVVHFTGAGLTALSDFTVISEHATLSEAQVAHASTILKDGVLIADYLDYGITF